MITKFEDFINEEIKVAGMDMDLKDLAELASRVGWEYDDFLKILNDAIEKGGEEEVVKTFNEITKNTPEIEYKGNGNYNIVSQLKSKTYNPYRYSGLRDA